RAGHGLRLGLEGCARYDPSPVHGRRLRRQDEPDEDRRADRAFVLGQVDELEDLQGHPGRPPLGRGEDQGASRVAVELGLAPYRVSMALLLTSTQRTQG